MSADRELLERAAKAAGMTSPEYRDGWHYSTVGPYGEGLYVATYRANHKFWNPLTDDGDALRLAVALKLDISHLRPSGVEVDAFIDGTRLTSNYVSYLDFPDPAAAVRVAIVRAAAALKP